jgi:hypothetical protein
MYRFCPAIFGGAVFCMHRWECLLEAASSEADVQARRDEIHQNCGGYPYDETELRLEKR